MTEIDRLEEELSRPTDALVRDMGRLEGDLLVLGAGGKMGPTLCRMAIRAGEEAGAERSVTAVSRFGDSAVRRRLEEAGVDTVAVDLLAPDALEALPDAPNVILMAGFKFGGSDDPEQLAATNVRLPGRIAERFASSRLVTLSTGNVYPLSRVTHGGSRETDALGPIGPYARSAVERERVLTEASVARGTPMAILRLNYAVEPRYGVLRDLADAVATGTPIDLTMGYVNVIWQRDANAIVLRSLHHCASPPLILNVTGPDTVSIRAAAQAMGNILGPAPHFQGVESDDALLSNAERCRGLLGRPPVSLDEMIERVGMWVRDGGPSLAKPTHYGERQGRF